ncbi:MAG: helix-turn-helix transcriptional regulator [Clostridia bacterium]|nr:helix-turn-helix transcriptional regulator [Clostridia bacterium]
MKSLIDAEKIYFYIAKNNLSKNKFAKLCKISVATLNSVLNGCSNTKVSTLFKICRVLDLHIKDLVI